MCFHPRSLSFFMDYNKFSYADQSGVHVTDHVFKLAAGESCDDLLKCSHLEDSSFIGCSILACSNARENAIDCNRLCRAILFSSCLINGGNQAAIVIKGECSNIIFKDCTITPSSRSWCDVLVDDWSDQSKKPSTDIDLRGLSRIDGKKIRIVFGRFKVPTYNKNTAKICWIKSAGLHVYNLVKGLFY